MGVVSNRKRLGLLVPLLVLLISSGAHAAPKRFGAYGAVVTSQTPTHYICVCSAVDLRFRDTYRSYTDYRVCWVGATRGCRRTTTGRRKKWSKITWSPNRVATYKITWYVGGHAVRRWRVSGEPETGEG